MSKRRILPRTRSAILSYLLLALGAVAVLFPLSSIIAVSLQPQGAPVSGLSWPSDPQWQNYVDAWTTGGFAVLLSNSAKVSAAVVIGATAFSVLSGFAFATLRFPGKAILFTILISGFLIPFEGVILPLYYTLRGFGLTDNLLGVILPEIGLFVSFGTFWMTTALKSVPRAVIDAARMDGAGHLQLLWRVLLPISWPAVCTLVVLLFVWSWNEFLVSLVILQDPEQRTAPAGLGAFAGEYTTNVPLLAAGAVIVAIPVVIVYVFLQKFLIQGLTQGAVKG